MMILLVLSLALLPAAVPPASAPGAAPAAPPAATPPDPAAEAAELQARQREAVERLQARFDREPDPRAVQRWTVSESDSAPARGLQLLRDARARGALPLLRLRGRYDDRSNRKWDGVEQPTARDHDADWGLDVWLEWDLAELASGSDQLRAQREARALTELRQAVVSHATVVFFDRRRVLTEAALDLDSTAEREAERRLRLQELDATLDGLTGGRWNEALATVDAPNQDPAHDPANRPGEDPHPGLRVPVHAADRAADPRGQRVLRDPALHPAAP